MPRLPPLRFGEDGVAGDGKVDAGQLQVVLAKPFRPFGGGAPAIEEGARLVGEVTTAPALQGGFVRLQFLFFSAIRPSQRARARRKGT